MSKTKADPKLKKVVLDSFFFTQGVKYRAMFVTEIGVNIYGMNKFSNGIIEAVKTVTGFTRFIVEPNSQGTIDLTFM